MTGQEDVYRPQLSKEPSASKCTHAANIGDHRCQPHGLARLTFDGH